VICAWRCATTDALKVHHSIFHKGQTYDHDLTEGSQAASLGSSGNDEPMQIDDDSGGGGGDDDDSTAHRTMNTDSDSEDGEDDEDLSLQQSTIEGLEGLKSSLPVDATLAHCLEAYSTREKALMLEDFLPAARDEIRLFEIFQRRGLAPAIYNEVRAWVQNAETDLNNIRSYNQVKAFIAEKEPSASFVKHRIELSRPIAGLDYLEFWMADPIAIYKEILRNCHGDPGGDGAFYLLLQKADPGPAWTRSELNQGAWFIRTDVV
jgi:hypothetical protein